MTTIKSSDTAGLKQAFAAKKVDVLQAAVDRQKAAAIKIWQGILDKTPVSTGRARANWNPSIGKPDGTTTDKVAKSGDRMADLQAVLDQLDTKPLGQTLWISNGLLYVKFLESGSSTQAPLGIVSVTLEEVKSGVV